MGTNPLSKQELNEVIYRSDFSLWIKEDLMKRLFELAIFEQMFKCTEQRKKDKTINYYVYSCLGYAYSGLIEGKNDTPFHVERFMSQMKKLDGENLENKKISFIEEIESVFSKEFITKV